MLLQNSFSQRFKGTFVIAAICKDGIIIAADTRLEVNKDGTPTSKMTDFDSYAYYFDSIQKIHPIRNFGFSSTGLASIGNNTLYYYLSNFEKSLNLNTTILEGSQKFFDYLRNTHPDVINQFLTMQIFMAGFEDGKPLLYLYEKQKSGYYDNGYLVSDGNCDFAKHYNSNLTCKQMSIIAEKTIRKFAKDQKQQHNIGGPIMILKISPDNKMTWLKNTPADNNFMHVTDIFKKYLEGKLKITFSSPNEKRKIDEMIQGWKLKGLL